MERKKVVSIIFFIILIVGIGLYVLINRETLFTNKITIDYPNGCSETYVNKELVSPKCPELDKLNSIPLWQIQK